MNLIFIVVAWNDEAESRKIKKRKEKWTQKVRERARECRRKVIVLCMKHNVTMYHTYVYYEKASAEVLTQCYLNIYTVTEKKY